MEKPFFVILTNSCNLSCPHCYNELDPLKTVKKKKDDPLERERLRFLFSSLIRRGYQKCFFSGGEPLLRSDCPDILKDAKEEGLKTALFTNGHVFNEDIISSLRGANLDEVRISLNELVWVRSDKQYERILARQIRWIPMLIEAGISVGVVYILSKLNMQYMNETLNRVRQLGAGMKIQPLFLPENVKQYESASLYQMDSQDWEGIQTGLEAVVAATDYRQEDKFKVYSNPWKLLRYFRFIREVYTLGIRPDFCPTGPMLVLDSDGYFHPCLFRFDLICGHISKDIEVEKIHEITDRNQDLCLAPCFREECLSAYR